MVDRRDTAEGILQYLQRSRALSQPCRALIKRFIEITMRTEDVDMTKVVVSTINDTSAFVYIYRLGPNGASTGGSSSAPYFRVRISVSDGIRLDYVHEQARTLASTITATWERESTDVSAEAIISSMSSGLDKVIAFKQGKAFEIVMREVGEFDASSLIKHHVEQRLGTMQASYSASMNSIRGNMEAERLRYTTQITELRGQSLGNLNIDWVRCSQGKFFPMKWFETPVMGLAAKIPVVVKRVKSGDRQYYLKKPLTLPDAIVFKESTGKWHVLDGDGDVYPHPHVTSHNRRDRDFGLFCTGSSQPIVEVRLVSSEQFERELLTIKDVIGSINWGSPYRTEFHEAYSEWEGHPNSAYKDKFKPFQAWGDLQNLGTSAIKTKYGAALEQPSSSKVINVD